MVEEVYSGKLREKRILYTVGASATINSANTTADLVTTDSNTEAFLYKVFAINTDGTNDITIKLQDHTDNGDVFIVQIHLNANESVTMDIGGFPITGTLQAVHVAGNGTAVLSVIAKKTEVM